MPVSPRRVPPVVTGWCGAALRAADLDHRFAENLAAPCVACMRTAPHEVVLYVTGMGGRRHPADTVGELAEPDPVGPWLFAAGWAALGVRHIVPDGAARHPRGDRLMLFAECGHTAWCPTAGPQPPPDWPVCAECLKETRRRNTPTTVRPDTSLVP